MPSTGANPRATAHRPSIVRRAAALAAAFVRNDRAWLVFFILVVLTLPIPLSYTSMSMPEFNEAPLERLTRERPEILFIGDSMLGSRLNPKLLSELSGRRVSVLVDNGSASGMWYLFVKNYVAALPKPLPRTIIFFRDRYLTDADFRLDGRYLNDLYGAMQGEDPVIKRFLDKPSSGLPGWLHDKVMALYPATRLHDSAADGLFETAAKYTRRILSGDTDVHDVLDQVFDIRNLRPDVPSDLASEDIEARSFDPSPATSFLPFILDSAHENNIDLWFYRVKRRPNDGLSGRKQKDALVTYIGQLGEWLSGQGSHLVDETGDPRLTIGLYGDGDHISAKRKDEYTRLFYEAHRDLFE